MIKEFVTVKGKIFNVKNGGLKLISKNIKSISEIKGLEKLVNLQGLYIAKNKITEIKGLEKLVNLQELIIAINQITEIKGLENLANLRELDLYHNQITEIKGLEKLANLQLLSIGDNPIPKNILEECGGINKNKYANNAQKFVKYCQKEIERKENERHKAERKEKEREKLKQEILANPCNLCNKEVAQYTCPKCSQSFGSNCWNGEFAQCKDCSQILVEIKENPCKICNGEIGKYECPDCDRKVGDNCWDKELAICQACKKKIMLLKGGSTPQASSQPVQALGNEQRYDQLRNLFNMSKEIPFSIAMSSLTFGSVDEMFGWLSKEGFPGLQTDFGAQMLKLSNKEEFNEFIDLLLE